MYTFEIFYHTTYNIARYYEYRQYIILNSNDASLSRGKNQNCKARKRTVYLLQIPTYFVKKCHCLCCTTYR